MNSLKALFRWLGQDGRDRPAINRVQTEHKLTLERLIELIERSGESPLLLWELRQEKQRLDAKDFESKIW